LNSRTTIWVQTACHVNAGYLATGIKIPGFMPRIVVLRTSQMGYMFTTRPVWRDPYFVHWYTHKVNWLQCH